MSGSVPAAAAAPGAGAAPNTNDLIMFWYDLYEGDARPMTVEQSRVKSEGYGGSETNFHEDASHVYMFGKLLTREAYADLLQQHGNQPGRIDPALLKTQSCCLVIKNIQRSVHVLPRRYKLADERDPLSTTEAEVSVADVVAEVRDIVKRRGITKQRSRTQTMKYCFGRKMLTSDTAAAAAAAAASGSKKDKKKKGADGDADDADNADADSDGVILEDGILVAAAGSPERASLLDPVNLIPVSAEYVNLQYSTEYESLPRELQGKTFSHVFGTRASKAELLLMSQQLRGPGWLSVRGAKQVARRDQISWCDVEYEVDSQSAVTPRRAGDLELDLPHPLLTVVSISLKTLLAGNNTHEVALATLCVHRGVNAEVKTPDQLPSETMTFLRPPKGMVWPHDLAAKARSFNLSKLVTADSEATLMSQFLRRIEVINPDAIVSHDLHGWGIELLVLCARRLSLGQQWSKLGRLKRTKLPRLQGHQAPVDAGAGAGRLMIDTQLSAREFLMGSKTYTLQHIAQEELGLTLKEVESSAVADLFARAESILALVELSVADAQAQLRLMFHLELVPLTCQLTTVCGNLWSRTLRSARAERVEYLLLHAFTRAGYLPPEKLSAQERAEREALERRLGMDAATDEAGVVTVDHGDAPANNSNNAGGGAAGGKKPSGKRRGKPQYTGGKVLEPKRGFYDTWIAVLDFNSLYPSIIREYNLCFSTTDHWVRRAPDDLQSLLPLKINADGTPVAPGILPVVVGRLIDRRKAVKDLMKLEKNEAERSSLDIRQLALKLVANSMYGCLGFPSSRFYCQPIAALITAQGRQALELAVTKASTNSAVVIYGDTDSIMIDTQSHSYTEAKQVAMRVQRAINQPYDVLRIAEDGLFKSMLLLMKKKYAALKFAGFVDDKEALERFAAQEQSRADGVMATTTEVLRADPDHKGRLLRFVRIAKGIDAVRRDWAPLSRECSNRVLDLILAGQETDSTIIAIKEALSGLRARIDEREVPLESYVMTKSLTKPPAEYTDARGLPHVQVALKMLADGRVVRVNDVIEYVITAGPGSTAERAVSKLSYVEALAAEKAGGDPAPELDLVYYKEMQVLPPVLRLCDVIEAVSAAELAEQLGVDQGKYLRQSRNRSGAGGVGAGEFSVFGDSRPLESQMDPHERFAQCAALNVTCPCCHTAYPFPGVYDYVPGRKLDHIHTLMANAAADAADAAAGAVPAGAGAGAGAPSTPQPGRAPSASPARSPPSLVGAGGKKASLGEVTMELAMARTHTDATAVARLNSQARGTDNTISGLRCPNPVCEGAMPSAAALSASLCNTVSASFRRLMSDYYAAWLVAPGGVCTRESAVALSKAGGPHAEGYSLVRKKLDDQAVYDQAAYYEWLFDQAEAKSTLEKEIKWRTDNPKVLMKLAAVATEIPAEHVAVFRTVKEHCKKIIDRFSYHHIDMRDIFQF
jgi:DNA polymerase elongation subunit (family B)